MQQNQTIDHHSQYWVKDILLLTIGSAILFGLFLGCRALGVPDGSRYSEIPREMVAHGHYITPHLNGILYFEKPPLFYWLQALSIKMFGLSEWSMRFWEATFSVLGCVSCYVAGRQLFSRRCGWLAGIILATSILYFVMAHLITLDMSVAIFLSASLFSFVIGTKKPLKTAARRNWMWTAYVLAALAVMTKGLIGIALPMMVIGLWIIVMNEWRVLKSMYLASGLAIFLIIAVPWHVLVQIQNPEFFHFYFINQQFLRYSTMVAKRYQPFWFFIPILLLGFYPWVVFLAQAIKHALPVNWRSRASHKETLFLLIWATSIFIFFSVSHSKLIPYILPVFPPLAVLVGRYLANAWGQRWRGVRWGFIILPVISLLLAIAILNVRHFTHQIPRTPEIDMLLYVAALFLIGTAMIIAVSYWRWGLPVSFIVVIVSTAIFLVSVAYVMPRFDTRSIKPLVKVLRPILKPADKVVSFRQYFQDLPFYLRRRVILAGVRGELGFGMEYQDTKGWVLSLPELWKLWESSQEVFMVARLKHYREIKKAFPNMTFFILAKTKRNILLSNHFVQREIKLR